MASDALAPLHLLLVDDEVAFRGVIAERLADHGYRVEQAGTGEEAVARLGWIETEGRGRYKILDRQALQVRATL